MNQVALNGNSTGLTDQNFVHFTDEQSGILLPSIPGYPFWLPQLQLSASGRLCFWNWPKTFTKSFCSNPAFAETYNFLIDAKYATQQGKLSAKNQFSNGGELLGIRNDIPSSGANGTYVWQSCTTFQIVTQAAHDYINSLTSVPMLYSTPSPSFPPVGAQSVVSPQVWIFLNIQYYILRYLNTPFNVWDAIPYNSSWANQFNKNVQGGDFGGFLNGCNFLIQPTPEPGFWDKVLVASPLIISALASIVTLGAATPALISAALAMASSTAYKGMSADMAKALKTQSTYQQLQTANLTQVNSDVSSATNPLNSITSAEKEFAFVSLFIIVLLFIFLKK